MTLTKNDLPDVWQAPLAAVADFTDVQKKSFDAISQGQNILATSPTGTGKTLAYLLPSLLKIEKKRGQQLLILAPNSELAGQIFEVVKTLSEPLGLSANLIISGASIKRQIERIKKAPEILVATPGRALELVKDKKIKMTSINTIILDEVDNLLEDSQWRFVKPIITRTPKNYQFIASSATAHDVFSSMQDFAPDLVEINVEKTGSSVDHFMIKVENRKKIDLLRQIAHIPGMRGLVFFNRLEDLGNAEEKLTYQNIAAVSIASDISGRFRKTIIEKFKNGDITLLLATDIAARGLDIDDLDYVINFDIPVNLESYTHRTGRTGRMGKSGTIVNIVGNSFDEKNVKKYQKQPEKMLKAGEFISIK
ncbi:DEAD/DEAH box helicase [Lactococcus insecticola]|uniref:DEAD/DEAH box helicase n=1 Tax=Pseudolactococcus insecticola TaxID=2709158 RepID=UPI00155521EB|nr:DEAD/DEAH box helicase [Lactococcus insecticola]